MHVRTPVLLALTLLLAVPAGAQSPGLLKLFPAQPTGYVTDQAGLLSVGVEQEITDQIVSVRDRLGGYIAVVTLPTIRAYEPSEVALWIGRTWKVAAQGEIGTDQRHLGVVVLVVPKSRDQRGRCYIATARGAEGFITDGTAGSMCREAVPHFRENDYESGVKVLVAQVATAMDKHVNPPPPTPPFDWTPFLTWVAWIAGVLTLIGVPWYMLAKRKWEREEAEREERDRELRKRAAAEYRARQERQQKERREAEARERARWAALTPEQQAAELAERERRAAEERKRAEVEAAARRKREAEAAKEAEEQRRRSSSSSYGGSSGSSPYGGGSSGSSGSSFGGFGGGSGFSGGGGGSNW